MASKVSLLGLEPVSLLAALWMLFSGLHSIVNECADPAALQAKIYDVYLSPPVTENKDRHVCTNLMKSFTPLIKQGKC